MDRKLYLAPIIHPPESAYSSNPFLSAMMEELTDKSFSRSIYTICDKLKAEKVDKIFFEGVNKKAPMKIFKYRQMKELCRSLKVPEIQKTESLLDMLIFPYVRKLHIQRLDNAMVNGRDYRMALNVSKGLKDKEAGLLVFGAMHIPEGYVQMIAPDIRLEYITKREDMIDRMVSMLREASGNRVKCETEEFLEIIKSRYK